MAENSPVRGCMIIKPYGYAVWENIQKHFDAMIKDMEVDNAYFPLLIPMEFMSREAEHVDGFAKECAVVTHHRLEADENGKLGLRLQPSWKSLTSSARPRKPLSVILWRAGCNLTAICP